MLKLTIAQLNPTVGDIETPEGRALAKRVCGMIARSEYKRRQAPPVIRLRPRAFGTGRQIPIAAQLTEPT